MKAAEWLAHRRQSPAGYLGSAVYDARIARGCAPFLFGYSTTSPAKSRLIVEMDNSAPELVDYFIKNRTKQLEAVAVLGIRIKVACQWWFEATGGQSFFRRGTAKGRLSYGKWHQVEEGALSVRDQRPPQWSISC